MNTILGLLFLYIAIELIKLEISVVVICLINS